MQCKQLLYALENQNIRVIRLIAIFACIEKVWNQTCNRPEAHPYIWIWTTYPRESSFWLSVLGRGHCLSVHLGPGCFAPSSMQQSSFLGYACTEDVALGAPALCRSFLLNCFLPFPVQHQHGGLRTPGLADPGTKAGSRYFPRISIFVPSSFAT